MIKVSMTKDMQELVEVRAAELNLSNPEYLRILANLDISMERYEQLSIMINVLYNKILQYQKKLGIHCAPLQECPVINLSTIEDEFNADN